MPLSPAFLAKFQRQGFREVGMFGLRGGEMYCEFNDSPALRERFAVYAFVGFTETDPVLRIGKYEGQVIKRLRDYAPDINGHRPSSKTKPWEKLAWLSYLSSFGSGLIFVNVIYYSDLTGSPDEVFLAKRARLARIENELTVEYEPRCCNKNSRPNARLKAEYEAVHGAAEGRKRTGAPA